MLFLAGSAQAKDVTGKVTYGTDAVGGIVSITGAIPLKGTVEEKDGKATGEFTVMLRDLKDDSWDLRTEHTKDLFEIQKWPTATLKLDSWTVSATDTPFDGQMTVKGVTKPVKGVAKVSGGKLRAGFIWKLADYPFKAPEHQKVKVAVDEDIKVSVEADVK
jgi:polyisoprenoid-binding protein YceI